MQPSNILPSAFQPNTTDYKAVPDASGGYNFYRIDTTPLMSNPVKITPITREVYVKAGYQDPTASTYSQSVGVAPSVQETPTTPTEPTTPTPEQIAAQQYESQKSGLKTTISDLIGRAKDIYGQLFGGAEKLAKEQKTRLEQQYGKGLGELAQTYATEMPKIAQAYAARGAYDSTFRAGAEQAAQQGYQKQLSDLAQAQKDVLAKLGQGYAETTAGYTGGQQALQTIADRLGSVTDVNELINLRNQLDTKLTELQTAKAGQLTQPEQQAAAAGIGGISDKFATASQTISTIINGQAPAVLKRQIASDIVINSDLTDAEKQQLQNRINSEIA